MTNSTFTFVVGMEEQHLHQGEEPNCLVDVKIEVCCSGVSETLRMETGPWLFHKGGNGSD